MNRPLVSVLKKLVLAGCGKACMELSIICVEMVGLGREAQDGV